MGMNYYAYYNICPYCGRGSKLHIGKASSGWCFALHVYPEIGIKTLDDWKEIFNNTHTFTIDYILDEDGALISVPKMLDIIVARSFDNRLLTNKYLEDNDAIAGPNGLLRHKISQFCIGYGEGPWDYIVGGFS